MKQFFFTLLMISVAFFSHPEEGFANHLSNVPENACIFIEESKAYTCVPAKNVTGCTPFAGLGEDYMSCPSVPAGYATYSDTPSPTQTAPATLAPITPQSNSSARGLTCDSQGRCSYAPLEPLPCPPGAANCQSGTTDLAGLMQTVFRVLFSLGALLAVGMLVAGGIEYMVSEVAHIKQQGIKRAQAAVYGILILAGSWLILNTINPQLLVFKFNLSNTPSSATPSNNQSPSNQPSAAQQAEDYCQENGLIPRAQIGGGWGCR